MKQEDPEEIVRAMHDVLAGRIYVSEEVMAATSKPAAPPSPGLPPRALAQLTDPELEILHLLGQGKTTGQIARQLRLGPRSVAASCSRLQKKLGLESPNELIRYAVCWVETGA